MAEQTLTDPTTGNQVSAGQEGQTGSVLTSTQNATQAERPAWMDQLPKELQQDAALTKFKTIGDMGKSYKELEGKLGKSVVIPDEKATPEEVQAYQQRLGRPETPEKYTFEGIPKDSYSPEMESNYRKWAFDLGLSQKQASGMFKLYNDYALSLIEKSNQAKEQQKTATVAALNEEWGASAKENFALMERAFARFGDQKASEDLVKTGAGNSPNIIKMFVNIGKAIREAKIVTSSTAAGNKPVEEVMYPNDVKKE